MRCSRNHPLLWLALFAGSLAVMALILITIGGLREMRREFYRVAPEESAAYAWIAEKGGTLRKEGKDRHIVMVNVAGARVSDSEVKHLVALTRLRELDLSGTQITDVGLRALAPLKHLEYLDVSHTHVTRKGIDVFASQHPQLKMVAFAGTDE